MKSDWAEVSFADAIDFREGPGIMARDFRESGVPLIRVAGLSGSSSVLKGCNYLDPKKVEAKWSHFKIKPGDTLLSTSASLGRVAVVEPEAEGAIPYTGIIRMRPNDSRVLASFIPYLLQGPQFQQQAEAAGSGSVLRHFGPSHLREMSVILPPIDEQRQISWILGALDKKIENNRKLAKTLEAVIASLFKRRFVDFDGHSSFVDSEIGPIPRGWEVAKIGEVLHVVGGATPSTKEPMYWDGGTHCWATPKDLSGLDEPVILDTARHITDAGVNRISSGLLPPQTVLMSSRAPIGYTAISFVPISVNQGFIAVPPSDHMPSEYTVFWMRANMERIKANAGGTTFAEISKRAFRPLPMLVPPREELDSFRKVSAPLIARIAGSVRENASLSSIRDALLPRLISGQFRVPTNAEPSLEVA